MRGRWVQITLSRATLSCATTKRHLSIRFNYRVPLSTLIIWIRPGSFQRSPDALTALDREGKGLEEKKEE